MDRELKDIKAGFYIVQICNLCSFIFLMKFIINVIFYVLNYLKLKGIENIAGLLLYNENNKFQSSYNSDYIAFTFFALILTLLINIYFNMYARKSSKIKVMRIILLCFMIWLYIVVICRVLSILSVVLRKTLPNIWDIELWDIWGLLNIPNEFLIMTHLRGILYFPFMFFRVITEECSRNVIGANIFFAVWFIIAFLNGKWWQKIQTILISNGIKMNRLRLNIINVIMNVVYLLTFINIGYLAEIKVI